MKSSKLLLMDECAENSTLYGMKMTGISHDTTR